MPLQLVIEHEPLIADGAPVPAKVLGDVLHGLVLDEVGDVEVARDAVVLRRGSPFDVGNSSEGKSSLCVLR